MPILADGRKLCSLLNEHSIFPEALMVETVLSVELLYKPFYKLISTSNGESMRVLNVSTFLYI